METELFSWVNWDEIDTGIHQYGQITLEVPVGCFNSGEMFDTALIDTQSGKLTLFRREIEFKFHLHFRVGESID